MSLGNSQNENLSECKWKHNDLRNKVYAIEIKKIKYSGAEKRWKISAWKKNKKIWTEEFQKILIYSTQQNL